ncbi:hypothetical protein [Agaribacter flavus]|uniref:Uncharacterized protein n=1 Tax=Agaribacter flavus TaxID=1902781 RepID=A0ABV7FNC1_9ALTE
MIQIAVAAFFVWCLFKFLDKEGYVDGFVSVTFVLVPAVIVFVVTIGVSTLEFPIWIAYVFELSYFLVPLLMLESMTEFKWSKIVGFSGAVFAINVITQAVFFVIFSGA